MKIGQVLIVGVSGFLGGYIAKLCNSGGLRVIGTDLPLSPPETLRLATYIPIGTQARGIGSVVEAIKPDICFHAAGRSSVASSFTETKADFTSGPVLTFELLSAIREHAPECRIVFLSSAAVYGNPISLPVGEQAPTAPISPYGFHKLQCESLCKEFSVAFGLKTASARIFSAYGEGLQRQVLWDICRRLIAGGDLSMRGTGEETRDFIHATDIAFGLEAILERAPMEGEVYNLATGREVSIRALALLAAEALGVKTKPIFDGSVSAGDPLKWRADMSALSDLGFRPTIGLEAGVASYAQWCQHQAAIASP
jgi:UDP-glucose 4-epimerase